MKTIQGKTFSGVVNIDGVHFVECIFTACMLVCSGNLPSRFERCTWNAPTHVHFAGAAHVALATAIELHLDGVTDLVGLIAQAREARGVDTEGDAS